MTVEHRRDIDGLRAVAVLPVILTHTGIALFVGGYVGVDVFFVISGYLITGILLQEFDDGRFSILRFYERRARRILPALIVVVAACFPFAWWLMWPDYLQNFGQSVVATFLFSNHLLLALTSGYWDLESAFKPLLHTWSLGVEEQFYLAFPWLLLLMRRFGRRAQVVAIVVVALLSFALTVHGSSADPVRTFYLPTTRAWELMAGCLAAFVPLVRRRADGWLSLAGLLAILGSVFAFGESTPQYLLVVPVIGTVLVLLFCQPSSLAGRLLSSKAVVGIGLISYSAYLWHQPLFAFARIARLSPPAPALMLALGALSLVLAGLTWRFVEQPFRSRSRVPLRVFVPIVTLACLAAIGGGLLLHVKQGFPHHTFPHAGSEIGGTKGYNDRVRTCAASDFARTNRTKVLVIGDSYGRDVVNLLVEAEFLGNADVVYAETWTFGPAMSHALVRSADQVVFATDSFGARQNIAWIRAVQRYARHPVLVIGTKEFGWNLNPFGRVPRAERPHARVEALPDFVELNRKLSRHFAPQDYVDLFRILGKDGHSLPVFDSAGNPISPDRSHLTPAGARFAAARLRAQRPDLAERFNAPSHRSADQGAKAGTGCGGSDLVLRPSRAPERP